MKTLISKKQKQKMLSDYIKKHKNMHSEGKESMEDEMKKGEHEGEYEGEDVAHARQMKQIKYAEYGESTGYGSKLEGIGMSPEESSMISKEMLWRSKENKGRSHSAPKTKLPLKSIKGSNR